MLFLVLFLAAQSTLAQPIYVLQHKNDKGEIVAVTFWGDQRPEVVRENPTVPIFRWAAETVCLCSTNVEAVPNYERIVCESVMARVTKEDAMLCRMYGAKRFDIYVISNVVKIAASRTNNFAEFDRMTISVTNSAGVISQTNVAFFTQPSARITSTPLGWEKSRHMGWVIAP